MKAKRGFCTQKSDVDLYMHEIYNLVKHNA